MRSINAKEEDFLFEYIQDETSLQILNQQIPQPKVEITLFEKSQLKIQLTFEEPVLVSKGSVLDQVLISLSKDYFLLALN